MFKEASFYYDDSDLLKCSSGYDQIKILCGGKQLFEKPSLEKKNSIVVSYGPMS